MARRALFRLGVVDAAGTFARLLLLFLSPLLSARLFPASTPFLCICGTEEWEV